MRVFHLQVDTLSSASTASLSFTKFVFDMLDQEKHNPTNEREREGTQRVLLSVNLSDRLTDATCTGSRV